MDQQTKMEMLKATLESMSINYRNNGEVNASKIIESVLSYQSMNIEKRFPNVFILDEGLYKYEENSLKTIIQYIDHVLERKNSMVIVVPRFGKTEFNVYYKKELIVMSPEIKL